MILELDVADVRDDHKIKMNAMPLKIGNIRKYAIHTKTWYHYAVGSICTLVAVMIAFVVEFQFYSFNVCSHQMLQRAICCSIMRTMYERYVFILVTTVLWL